jgi:hypothetical protein
MKTAEFREAYAPLRESRLISGDSATTELQAAGREWSGRFSTLLDNRLDGEIIPEDDAISIASGYVKWASRYSERLRDYIHEKAADDTMTDEKWDDALNLLQESHFHTMSMHMATNWVRLLSGHDMSRRDVMTSRNSLALTGIGHLAVMASIEKDGDIYQRDEKGEPVRSKSLLGFELDPVFRYVRSIANEADTANTLQEVTITDPSVVVIPAPGRYEHSRDGSMNIDFIAVDALRSQVRGIQAKVSVGPLDASKYNADFVTLIDGERDLGNVKPVRLPQGSSRRTTPWPGLISAHHLLAQKDVFRERSQRGKGVILGPRERELVRQRQEARFLAGSTKPFNAKAARYVTERLLHDMYDQEAA